MVRKYQRLSKEEEHMVDNYELAESRTMLFTTDSLHPKILELLINGDPANFHSDGEFTIERAGRALQARVEFLNRVQIPVLP